MNFLKITEDYYSQWLGTDALSAINEIQFIYSQERNAVQYGYSKSFDIYCFYQAGKTVISYGDKAREKIHCLRDKVKAHSSLSELKAALCEVYNASPNHNVKFVFDKLQTVNGIARTLCTDNYPAYLDFFKRNNPGCKNTDWVNDYFNEMITNKLCVGIYEDDILVSCTDAPGMPYMSDKVQEVGINTLPYYRGKGYASAACSLCTRNIIESGKCPQWSTEINNTASEKLAYKVGFIRYADVLTVTI